MIDPQTAALLGIRPTVPAAPDTGNWFEQLQEHNRKENAVVPPVLALVERAEVIRESNQLIQEHVPVDRGRQIVASGVTTGLPADLVERARSAVAAERAAQQALIAATAAANAWIERHGEPSSELKDKHTLAKTASREATEAATAACVRLGRAAEQIQQAQQVLATEQQRRQDADRAWDIADEQITADVKAARRIKADLGV